jgi:DNA-binding NtrC family response regulator
MLEMNLMLTLADTAGSRIRLRAAPVNCPNQTGRIWCWRLTRAITGAWIADWRRRRMDKETVLIVDDEEMVLTSLSTYLTLETTYDVVTFTSAARALQYVEKNDVGVIISDFLMPEMDGIVFLARAKELRPDAPRVLLTGYADKENAIKAINQVGLYQYVEKPWDNDDIRLIIRNGLEKKQLLAKLTQKVSQINQAYSELQSIQQEILKAFA